MKNIKVFTLYLSIKKWMKNIETSKSLYKKITGKNELNYITNGRSVKLPESNYYEWYRCRFRRVCYITALGVVYIKQFSSAIYWYWKHCYRIMFMTFISFCIAVFVLEFPFTFPKRKNTSPLRWKNICLNLIATEIATPPNFPYKNSIRNPANIANKRLHLTT